MFETLASIFVIFTSFVMHEIHAHGHCKYWKTNSTTHSKERLFVIQPIEVEGALVKRVRKRLHDAQVAGRIEYSRQECIFNPLHALALTKGYQHAKGPVHGTEVRINIELEYRKRSAIEGTL